MTKDEILKARRIKMTDEEKAEEYVNSECFGSDYNNIDSNKAKSQAYLDGLAEGRKEKEELRHKLNDRWLFYYQCKTMWKS